MSKSPAWGRERGSVCETVEPVAKLLTALDPVPSLPAVGPQATYLPSLSLLFTSIKMVRGGTYT